MYNLYKKVSLMDLFRTLIALLRIDGSDENRQKWHKQHGCPVQREWQSHAPLKIFANLRERRLLPAILHSDYPIGGGSHFFGGDLITLLTFVCSLKCHRENDASTLDSIFQTIVNHVWNMFYRSDGHRRKPWSEKRWKKLGPLKVLYVRASKTMPGK